MKMGFSTSLMERLFAKPLYQRHPSTGQYNQVYITQLVRNYRSHAAILHISNALFYENKLKATAHADVTDWFIQSKLLPSRNFPIILKNVLGYCKRSPSDFRYENCDHLSGISRFCSILTFTPFPNSFHNQKEIDVVMDYIKKLLTPENGFSTRPIKQSDIGVVAPYKLQCKLLACACRQCGFNDITVGTAEIFQGQERPVMIISTVRTDKTLGFVNDARVSQSFFCVRNLCNVRLN